MFIEVLKKYWDSIRSILMSRSDKILHEMNGIVLIKTSDHLFNLHTIMANEVFSYCSNNGYKVNKIIFITSYENDCSIDHSIEKTQKHWMKSDSKISIVEKEDKIIAKIFMGTKISIEG